MSNFLYVFTSYIKQPLYVLTVSYKTTFTCVCYYI
nr:MAG TPA: hypothetical protein [Crassvirales sp.]